MGSRKMLSRTRLGAPHKRPQLPVSWSPTKEAQLTQPSEQRLDQRTFRQVPSAFRAGAPEHLGKLWPHADHHVVIAL